MNDKKPFLMGMSVWGAYIDTFLKWTLPSLMTAGNLPALCKKYHVLIDIHTDAAGGDYIRSRLPFIAGVDFRVALDVDLQEEKYTQLGRHQHSDLREAKRIGADYHLLMPDFIYSENCFAGVISASKKHKAIARLVMSTTQEEITQELNYYRNDGALSVAANHLATLGIKHIHSGVKHWFASRESYPNTHVLAWQSENLLHMCSPHCSPVFIANEVIHIPSSIKSLDSILDQIITGDIYCTKPDDGIVIIEMSPKSNRRPNDNRIDIVEFCRIFRWDTNNSARQWALFTEETIDPICRDILGGEYWNDVDISKQKSIVINALMHNLEG